jgi:hypothetical protein
MRALTPKIVADDEQLAQAIDAVTIRMKTHRRARRKIVRAQDELHRLVDDSAWKAYLKLEQAVNERDSDEVDVLVRWAFRAGVRWARRA